MLGFWLHLRPWLGSHQGIIGSLFHLDLRGVFHDMKLSLLFIVEKICPLDFKYFMYEHGMDLTLFKWLRTH